ncbi:MAG: pyridoxamine 5'-phosphate oxidase family protein [Bacillota bacterium]|nr:pyridoxamine 5'-phosphate oxidase family protein [Bacillota bacterium]
MIPEKFLEVLKHEGVAAIATQGEEGPYLSNTWNSYVQVSESGKLIYPAGGMKATEANIEKNNRILMTIGSREVAGFNGPGTGFRIKGIATFLKSGIEFDKMKQQFPWARAVVEITIDSITQTL